MGIRVCLCAVVATKQDLYNLLCVAKRLLKVVCLISAMNLPSKFKKRTNSLSTPVHIVAILSF